MKGRARAAKRSYEDLVTQAWHTANFANAKKLKDLRHYLGSDDAEPEPVKPEVILDAMMTMQASGVAMTIQKIE